MHLREHISIMEGVNFFKVFLFIEGDGNLDFSLDISIINIFYMILITIIIVYYNTIILL